MAGFVRFRRSGARNMAENIRVGNHRRQRERLGRARPHARDGGGHPRRRARRRFDHTAGVGGRGRGEVRREVRLRQPPRSPREPGGRRRSRRRQAAHPLRPDEGHHRRGQARLHRVAARHDGRPGRGDDRACERGGRPHVRRPAVPPFRPVPGDTQAHRGWLDRGRAQREPHPVRQRGARAAFRPHLDAGRRRPRPTPSASRSAMPWTASSPC